MLPGVSDLSREMIADIMNNFNYIYIHLKAPKRDTEYTQDLRSRFEQHTLKKALPIKVSKNSLQENIYKQDSQIVFHRTRR